MASKRKKQKDQTDQQIEEQASSARTPWIAYKTGIIIIAITSLGMAILTFVQALQFGYTIPEAIFKAFEFGILIWIIFFGYLYFTRFLRRL